MWIDAHHHLWDPSVRPQTWMDQSWPINRPFDTGDLRAAIEGTPVEATIVVQTEPIIDETLEMLSVAAADPLIAGVVGWLDLHNDVNRQLDELATSHGDELLVGVRHQAESEADPNWLSTNPVVESVRALGRRGLTYDLLVKPHQLASAINLAQATHDATRLVLDHCAKPPIGSDLTNWTRSIRTLAGFEHVACKLSGLVTEADWAAWTPTDLTPVSDVVLARLPARRHLPRSHRLRWRYDDRTERPRAKPAIRGHCPRVVQPHVAAGSVRAVPIRRDSRRSPIRTRHPHYRIVR